MIFLEFADYPDAWFNLRMIETARFKVKRRQSSDRRLWRRNNAILVVRK